MRYFPIFLDSQKIDAIIIGGGDVAARKIELLLKTPAKITVVSKQVCAAVQQLIERNNIEWLAHDYQAGLLTGKNLVIAATNNNAVNQAVAAEASTLKLLHNVVDQPELCSYITPAIIDRSPIIIALCSSGSAPIILRMLREKIEKMLPERYGLLAEFSGKFRDKVKQGIANLRDRRTFWETALVGNIGKAIMSGDEQLAEKLLNDSLNNKISPATGEIVVIYTGNGDPDNLTLKAHRAAQFADAVIFDNKTNSALIEYIRRDAAKVYVDEVNDQDAIDQGLELMSQGEKVIYLVAGQPNDTSLSFGATPVQTITSGC